MRKLSLLIFAILLLGCGTEKPVVEEPVIEEPEPVVEEPPPVAMEAGSIAQPELIANGNVKHGQVNIDPELLNRRGFHFQFAESFANYQVWLYAKTGEELNWEAVVVSEWDRRDAVWIRPMADDDLLEYDTEYILVMSFQDSDCDYTDIVIQFRTKPQRPVVGAPEPAIQERPPVAPSGERFRHDIAAPAIVAGDVRDGEDNVDPEPLNANGIQFEWDEPLRKYKIDLRLDGGASLGWLPRGLVEPENPVRHIKIMPAEGFPLLEFDTIYEINFFVQDFGCRDWEFRIMFRTKPQP